MQKIEKILKEFNGKVLYFDTEVSPQKTTKSVENCVFTNSLNGAFNLTQKFMMNLVILELTDNEDVFKLIKSLKKNGQTKIIARSYRDDFDTIFRAYQSGIDLFIPKGNEEYFHVALQLFLKDFSRIIISKNEQLQQNYKLLKFYAEKITTDVLILGENGTGKGIMAKALYELSGLNGDFVTQNCAGIPESLFESEMFGYKAGAFTGADKNGKMGVFEKANKGILFLDEIGDLPLSQQAKLLRAIQRKRILKVGSVEEIKISPRFIYATNRNLLDEVKNDTFREDMYYRLKGAEISIPPLRQTPEDLEIMIAIFANRFLREHAINSDTKMISLNENLLHQLKKYEFPGNMRELQKIVYQAMIKMLAANSNELRLCFQKPEEEQQIIQGFTTEVIWDVLELLENNFLKYGGIVHPMKAEVMAHLRTKYNDNREKIAKILKFKDKQSLANEIYRLEKHKNI